MCVDIKVVDEEGNILFLLVCGESYIDFENFLVKFNIIKFFFDNGSLMDDYNNKFENVFYCILCSCYMWKVSILLKFIEERDSVCLFFEEDNLGFILFYLLCGVDYKYDKIMFELVIFCFIKMVGFDVK